MLEQFSRTALLLGKEGIERLSAAKVAVFGVGGVGGFAAEALVRSGVGHVDLIDDDKVTLSNLNRQIFALHSTVGKYKVDVAKERLLDICPQAEISAYKIFFSEETAGEFDFSAYDHVIDAIDTVSAKLTLAELAYKAGTPLISSMGAGNKLDPTAFTAADIFETSVCPLARVMRRELKKMGIPKLKVVYSKEQPIVPDSSQSPEETDISGHAKRQTPGSVAFVPSVAGLIIAGEVIKQIVGME